MYLFDVAPESAELLYRAMRAVALADGAETAKERALLEVAREALGPRFPAEGAIEPSPLTLDEATEVARGLDGRDRERIVQAMLLMALMDGEGSPEEAKLVREVASRLEVDEPRVKNLSQLASGRLAFMQWDLTRRGYAKDELLRTAKEEGLRGLYRTFGPLLGLATNHETAKRYNDLGKLPEGTLGRAYWHFIVDNDLSFPGESHAVAERGTWHDLSHVLGGYPITPRGEALVVAFIAGYRKEDPFFWLFTIALQFQVGLRISPFSPGVRDQVDPKELMRHHARGAALRRDISEGWDFWGDFTRPVEELRRELNVLPVEAFGA